MFSHVLSCGTDSYIMLSMLLPFFNHVLQCFPTVFHLFHTHDRPWGVRDAVIRGDRTIIRNLEKAPVFVDLWPWPPLFGFDQATKISNDNMKKMVEWSTEANRVETEYLDKKIDHSLKAGLVGRYSMICFWGDQQILVKHLLIWKKCFQVGKEQLQDG